MEEGVRGVSGAESAKVVSVMMLPLRSSTST
jgi:hypothetical protein